MSQFTMPPPGIIPDPDEEQDAPVKPTVPPDPLAGEDPDDDSPVPVREPGKNEPLVLSQRSARSVKWTRVSGWEEVRRRLQEDSQ